MRSIEISAYKSFELYIEKDPFINEWTLSLIARYEKKDISRPHQDITTQGFYLIKLERCAIIFTNRDSSEICSIQAYIDKVWHSTNSPSFKLKAKITPFALQEIYQKTKGQNLMVRWDISGYGFPHERERNYYENIN